MRPPVWEAVDPRQITGAPLSHYGYVRRVGTVSPLFHCHPGGIHKRRGSVSGAVYARRCAEREARRRNRTPVSDERGRTMRGG